MKVLNLYAGIGGNRKLWTGCEVTAVEYRQDIADVYKHYFQDDTVIVGDAHEYLLEHYSEYDFIWSSTPCPTWSRANYWASKTAANREKYYPDMKLYQEIIFLKHWYKGRFVVENVDPYCEPLIAPDRKLGRHLFWSNFYIPNQPVKEADIHKGKREDFSKVHGFDLSGHVINSRKDQIYRNCVHPETGLMIFNAAMNIQTPEAQGKFVF
jgi:DNA (cytosine-5)-methyltransferase 1